MSEFWYYKENQKWQDWVPEDGEEIPSPYPLNRLAVTVYIKNKIEVLSLCFLSARFGVYEFSNQSWRPFQSKNLLKDEDGFLAYFHVDMDHYKELTSLFSSEDERPSLENSNLLDFEITYAIEDVQEDFKKDKVPKQLRLISELENFNKGFAKLSKVFLNNTINFTSEKGVIHFENLLLEDEYLNNQNDKNYLPIINKYENYIRSLRLNFIYDDSNNRLHFKDNSPILNSFAEQTFKLVTDYILKNHSVPEWAEDEESILYERLEFYLSGHFALSGQEIMKECEFIIEMYRQWNTIN